MSDTNPAQRRTPAPAAAPPTSVRRPQAARAAPSAARRRRRPGLARATTAAAAARIRSSAAKPSFDAELRLGGIEQIEFHPVARLRRILHAADAVFLHEAGRGLDL